MSSCCLRRTKEMQDKNGRPLIPLPPVVINVVRVQLDEKSRQIYDDVERESRNLIQNFYGNSGRLEDASLVECFNYALINPSADANGG